MLNSRPCAFTASSPVTPAVAFAPTVTFTTITATVSAKAALAGPQWPFDAVLHI